MTVKELQKLRRQELLQLLVEQGRAIASLKDEQEEKEQERLQFEDSNDRLGKKVEEKDILIERLQGRLNKKEEQINELRAEKEAWCSDRQAHLEQSDSIADAVLRLNRFCEMAQQAADQYLYNIRQRCMGQAGMNALEPVDIGRSGK